MRAAVVIGSQLIGIGLTIAVVGGLGLMASVLVFVIAVIGPGILVTRALTGDDRLSLASSAVLATGLGITVAIGLGLLLDRTPLGLAWLGPILILVAVLGVAGATWKTRRERPIGRMLAGLIDRYSIGYDEAVLLLIGLTLVTGALVIARAGAVQTLADGAQLWIVPNGTNAQVGAANIGATSESWRVVVTGDGGVVLDEPVTLAPGQRWTATLQRAPGAGEVDVALLDAVRGTPLREVRLAGAD